MLQSYLNSEASACLDRRIVGAPHDWSMQHLRNKRVVRGGWPTRKATRKARTEAPRNKNKRPDEDQSVHATSCASVGPAARFKARFVKATHL